MGTVARELGVVSSLQFFLQQLLSVLFDSATQICSFGILLSFRSSDSAECFSLENSISMEQQKQSALPSQTIYVVDKAIRQITSDGKVTTLYENSLGRGE